MNGIQKTIFSIFISIGYELLETRTWLFLLDILLSSWNYSSWNDVVDGEWGGGEGMRNVLLDVVGHLALESRFHVWGRGFGRNSSKLPCTSPGYKHLDCCSPRLIQSLSWPRKPWGEDSAPSPAPSPAPGPAPSPVPGPAVSAAPGSSQQAYVLTTAQQRLLGKKFWWNL